MNWQKIKRLTVLLTAETFLLGSLGASESAAVEAFDEDGSDPSVEGDDDEDDEDDDDDDVRDDVDFTMREFGRLLSSSSFKASRDSAPSSTCASLSFSSFASLSFSFLFSSFPS